MLNIKAKAISAVKWTSITTVITQILTFFISVFKFRILDAGVFGTMAIVISIISILRMVQTMGFGPAIVQKEKINNIFIDSVFWVVFCTSLFLATILISFSGLISQFYNLEILSLILIIAAIQFVFHSLIVIQSYLLERELKFKKIGLISLCSTIFEGLIIIFLALNNFGIWSLVFGSIGSSIILFLLLLMNVKWIPSFNFSSESIRSSINFSLNITFQKILAIIKLNLPQLIIGKYFSVEILGLYSFAKNIILQIINNIDAMVSKVLFPLFSRLQNDKVNMLKGYLKVNYYNFILSIPIIFGYIFIARHLIEIVYGSKWLPAITISQILLLSILLNSIYTKGSSLITGGLGRPEYLLKIELLLFAPMIIGLLVSAKLSLIYFVTVIVLERFIAFIMQQVIISKNINYKFNMLINVIKSPIIASIIMLIILIVLEPLFPILIYPKISLIGLILFGGGIYFLVLFFLDKAELIPTLKLLLQTK